ncbi:MAG: tetratricopeptide repeat protein [Pyrinomonadaceae bacterium]
MKELFDNFKFLVQLYLKPHRAMSNIIDRGSWLFGVFAVVAVSFAFQYSVNSPLHQAFGIPRYQFELYEQPELVGNLPNVDEYTDEELYDAEDKIAHENYQKAVNNRQKLPLVGDYGLWFFSFSSLNFLSVLLGLTIFYVPATILTLFLFEPFGNYSMIFRREYGVTLTCTLMAWTAAHLPFAVIGIILKNQLVNPNILLGMWLASGLIFGVFMLFALRTVFGASWRNAIATICLSWLSISFGGRLFNYISPYFFSPFLLFYAYAYFRGEVSAFGNSYRARQNFRRFLNTATLNPNDAEAHIQLGLLYNQRRQTDEARKHFEKAVEIEPQEIDANYELGKIARQTGDLQTALARFSVVAEQNDKYAGSEIWREIGTTYFAAKAYGEAREFLEKFIERRPFDPEGLYLLGQTLKSQGENEKAREMFRRCVEAVQTSPDYRRGTQRKWGRLANSQLKMQN